MSTATAIHADSFSSLCPSVSSVVNPSPAHLPHAPHTAHPIPLREHAFTLHWEGLRSPAIAAALGVSQRTIRAWIAAALAELKDDLQLSRKEQLLLAVERQHQLTATAWQQFEAEAAARNALLDAALATLLSAANSSSDAAGASTGPSTRPLHLHLPASTPAPRYLSLILQANKETNRLLGLHTLAKLHLLTPEPTPIPLGDSENAAESATGFANRNSVIPAKTATALTDLVSESPAKTAPECEIAAESAIDSPLSAHGEGLGVRFHSPAKTAPPSADSKIPAESATASTRLTAGIQPASPRPPHPVPSIAPSGIMSPSARSEAHAARRATIGKRNGRRVKRRSRR